MAAIPSVIIGLGTSGSEIIVRVFHGFKEHCEKTGENPDIIQFLMLDTDDAVPGSEELNARNDHLMVGTTRGERLRKALWDADPFFREWWFEEYVDIGRLYPGAGTVPIKGRLAFWSKLGDRHGEDNFGLIFKQKALQATNAAPGAGLGLVNVFLVGTLSGGTGAGIFMDVAQVINNITEVETLVHTISILPDIVHLRARPAVHQQTAANGYGSLVSMNYWLTPKERRPVRFGDFMRRGGEVFSGDIPPIDVAWLISRVNQSNRALTSWDEYKLMCADAISMMIYEDQAGNIQGRFNDFIDRLRPLVKYGTTPQPKRFGSFATYSLRYHPDRAVKYLAGQIAQNTIDHLLASPEDLSNQVIPLVQAFMEKHKLREIDETGEGRAIDEVLEELKDYDNSKLKLYPPIKQIVSQLTVTGSATPLVVELDKSSVTEGNLSKNFKSFKGKVEKGLEGKLTRQPGVNYSSIIEDNRKEKFTSVTRSLSDKDVNLENQITGLYQQVDWLIGQKEAGIAKAKRFLEILLHILEANRVSLELEIEGIEDQGIEGDRARLAKLEQMEDSQLANLKQNMFSGLGILRNKRRAIQTFEQQWWKPWLSNKIMIRVKEEAVLFYLALEKEIETFLLPVVQEAVPEYLKRVQADYYETTTQIYGGKVGADEAKLEEDAVRKGEVITEYFAADLIASYSEIKEIIAQEIGKTVFEYISTNNRTLENRRKTFLEFMEKVSIRINEECEIRFGTKAEELSLWDVLSLDSKQTDPDKIRQAIETRVQNLHVRCSPFWQISPGLIAFDGRKHTIVIYSYDESELEKFKAKTGISDIEIMPSAQGGARNTEILGVEKLAFQASPHELKIINLEGGVPLHFIDGVNLHESNFMSWMKSQDVPCFRDARFLGLIDQVGIPTWKITKPIKSELTKDTYQLLIAEQLEIFSTPLVSKLRTTGPHRFDTNALGSSRSTAFAKLSQGGEYYDIARKKLPRLIEEIQNQFSLEDWEYQHIEAVARINFVLQILHESEAKQLLLDHKQILLEHILEVFGQDSAQVETLIDKRQMMSKFERMK